MLQWQFLGTSAGMPTKTRNVSALAVGSRQHKPWLLIDCGEATQHQLLHTHWSSKHLSAICITHAHGDHCYGLPGVVASASMHKRSAPLTIIAPEPVWQWLQHTIALTDMHLTFDLHFVDVESLHSNAWCADGFSLTSHALNHRVPSHAYRIEYAQTRRHLNFQALEQANIAPSALWGLLQQGQDVVHEGACLRAQDYTHQTSEQVCVVVAGDNDTPSLLQDACVDAQVLVHEATYTQEIADKVGAFPMHSSALQVADFAQKMGLPNLILTHFSARYATPSLLKPLLHEAQTHYQGNVFLAADFQQYQLQADGSVLIV